MKRVTILKKFSTVSIITAIVVIALSFTALKVYQQHMTEIVYKNTKQELLHSLELNIDSKKSIGITNAYSIANDSNIQKALSLNQRNIAITSLNKINKSLKNGTSLKNAKVHIHTKDNKSFVRNWKTDKFGDDLSSFRASVVKVNNEKTSVNNFEVGKAGLSLRSVAPIFLEDKHQGSLEFIQGLNSVAKIFNKTNEGFLLLMDMDKKIVDPKADKIFKSKYIISQNFVNENFLENLKKQSLSELLKNGYLIGDNYFYTYKIVKDFRDERLGIIILAEPMDIVLLAINETNNLIYLALIALILTLLINLFVTMTSLNKMVLRPMQNLKQSIAIIAKESDLKKVDIVANDEIGDVIEEFNIYIDSIIESKKIDNVVIKEAQKAITRANKGLFNTYIESTASTPGINMLAQSMNNLIKETQLNLDQLSKVLISFSNAEFDYPVESRKGITGELASIMSGAKNTGETLSGILALIFNTTQKLLTSSSDLKNSSTTLSNASNLQASGLEEASAAIEETLNNLKLSSKNATKMSQLAQHLNTSSQDGVTLANKTSQSMGDITDQVSAISEAIKTIDQISFQTNILSLNAAVEAATAGEAGKGFAVVAQEVRNLAGRSAEAANEIKNLVENASNKANEGKKISSDMINGYTTLTQNIESTITLIDEVAKSSHEQQSSMSQISNTVNDLDKVTQENANVATMISTMATANEVLAKDLDTAIERTTFFESSKNRVCDVDKLFDFGSLKADHIKFKDTNLMKCASGEAFQVTNHHSCRMGKWIDSVTDEDVLSSPYWTSLTDSHRKVHMMTQDTVNLYAGGYDNGQIFAVTENLEKNLNIVFHSLDLLREESCKNTNTH